MKNSTRTVCSRTVLGLAHWLARAWRRFLLTVQQAQYGGPMDKRAE